MAVGLENVGKAKSTRSLSGAVTRVVSPVDAAELSVGPVDTGALVGGAAADTDELFSSVAAMREAQARPAPINVNVARRPRFARDVVSVVMMLLL